MYKFKSLLFVYLQCNSTNILCETIKSEIQKEEKKFEKAYYRVLREILWRDLKKGSSNCVCKINTENLQ